MMKKQLIVVVGGGFAGLNFARAVDKKKFDVVVVDKNNYHSFPPLFYQIASSGIDPESISFPFRREFRKGRGRGIEFRLGEVKNIDSNHKVIETQYETIVYDKLVLANGSTNNFFGNDKLQDVVFTVKSIAQSLRIRNQVLEMLEQASLCKDEANRKQLLTFVVVGGGATGVEVAGALGEMKRYIIRREYPNINPSEIKIILLEGTNCLLGAMTAKSRQKALTYLRELMVDVKLGVMMKSFDGQRMELSDGQTINLNTVIWTAGITAVEVNNEAKPLALGHGRRIKVSDTNAVEGIDDVYAIGDICIMTTENYPNGHPQLAQVAIQQGSNLAHNLNKGTAKKFVYRDKGTMATIGKNRAVADLCRMTLSGWIAWVAWMFVHLVSILGMRNKLLVLINWIWSYFTYATSLRLIIKVAKYPLKGKRYAEKNDKSP